MASRSPDVVRSNEKSVDPVPNRFRHASDVRRQHRLAQRHAFQDDTREALGGAREGHHVRPGHDRRRIGAVPQQVDAFMQVQSSYGRFQFGLVGRGDGGRRPAADPQDRLPAGGEELAHSADRQDVVFQGKQRRRHRQLQRAVRAGQFGLGRARPLV